MSRDSAARETGGYTPEEIEAMETPALLDLYKRTGDESLKWPLVLRYEGLIKSAALQIRGVYSSFAQVGDIVNEGILTLLSCIDLARKQDWLPRNVRQRAKEIDQAVSELSNELGRFPSDGEVAQRLGISVEKYQKDAARVALDNTLSLDALMDSRDPEGYRFEVASEDARSQPESALQDQELQQTLAVAIQTLQKNEQIVLSLYYEKNLHMKEIAQVMEVSEPRISQIHARAIQKLRDYMTSYMNGTPVPKHSKKRKKG